MLGCFVSLSCPVVLSCAVLCCPVVLPCAVLSCAVLCCAVVCVLRVGLQLPGRWLVHQNGDTNGLVQGKLPSPRGCWRAWKCAATSNGWACHLNPSNT